MNCRKKVVSLTLTLAVLASSHASTCVGSIPYGIHEGLLTLPRSSKFCVYEGGKSVFYETDEFGGRLLGDASKTPINIFGESQALVIDSDGIPSIYTSFGIDRARIYATPNNGPYEWLSRLVKRQYSESGQNFFIINLGFDIFRLNSSWIPKDLVDVEIEDIENLMNWPRLLTARLALSQFKLRRSTLAGDDRKAKKDLFQSNRDQYLADLQRWFDLARTIFSNHAFSSKNAMFLIVLPYWLDSSSTNDLKALSDLKNAVACGINEQLPAKLISYSYGPSSVTTDARHFAHYAIPKIEPPPTCER
jgi:hypothetical protein